MEPIVTNLFVEVFVISIEKVDTKGFKKGVAREAPDTFL